MRLIYTATGKEAKHGDQVQTFRGEPCTLAMFTEPHKPSSTGRVYVRFPDSEGVASFFPSVIGAEWIERGDR